MSDIDKADLNKRLTSIIRRIEHIHADLLEVLSGEDSSIATLPSLATVKRIVNQLNINAEAQEVWTQEQVKSLVRDTIQELLSHYYHAKT